MPIVDILLIIILAGFVYFGLFFGFFHTLGSLIGAILGIYLGTRFADPLFARFGDQLGGEAATVAVVGRRYGYDIGDRMYAARHALNVAIQAEPLGASAKLRVRESVGPSGTLERSFERAMQGRPDYVVVHEPVWGPKWPAPENVGGFVLAKTFEFGGLRLFVYTASAGA